MLAIDALVKDNRDEALKAASEAERNTTFVAAALHGAVVERTHSIMGFEGSGHVMATQQEGNSLYHNTVHMSHKEVHAPNQHSNHHLKMPFDSLFHRDSKSHPPSEKAVPTSSSHEVMHSTSQPTQIPKILENSEYVASPKKLDPFVF